MIAAARQADKTEPVELDPAEREFLVETRRWLINRMRADAYYVRAIEKRAGIKPMQGRPQQPWT